MSLPGRQPPPLGKVQAQDPVVTKAFDDLRAKLQPALASTVLGMADWRIAEDDSKNLCLQYRTPPNSWATVASFTSNGQIAQQAWNAVVGGVGFQNSWTTFGAGTLAAAFYKDANGIVHVRGSIKSGAVGTVAFTLPSGYRPSANLYAAVTSNNGSWITGTVLVDSSGNVTPQTGCNSALVSLDGITFDTR